MKRTWKVALAVVVVSSLALVAGAAVYFAPTINDKCPIKGDDVTDKTTDVKIKLCSDACKAKFDKDQGSFLAKITKIPNVTCPVDAKPCKDVESTVVVGLCCGNCKGTFDMEIGKYWSKVKPAKAKK